jgi:DNA/RNA endonuclease YhcR with UshA esterase domain
MRQTIIAALALVAMAAPVSAHHAFDAEFDANAPATVTGSVTDVNWSDPHVVIHVDVKDQTGRLEKWSMEAGSVTEMRQQGWAADTLKPGETITVQGFRAKANPLVMTARTIELPGGKKMTSATKDGGPQSL